MAAVLLAPYAGKGKSIKPKDLIEFPWEKEEKVKQAESAKAEREKKFAKWDEEMRKKWHG